MLWLTTTALRLLQRRRAVGKEKKRPSSSNRDGKERRWQAHLRGPPPSRRATPDGAGPTHTSAAVSRWGAISPEHSSHEHDPLKHSSRSPPSQPLPFEFIHHLHLEPEILSPQPHPPTSKHPHPNENHENGRLSFSSQRFGGGRPGKPEEAASLDQGSSRASSQAWSQAASEAACEAASEASSSPSSRRGSGASWAAPFDPRVSFCSLFSFNTEPGAVEASLEGRGGWGRGVGHFYGRVC